MLFIGSSRSKRSSLDGSDGTDQPSRTPRVLDSDGKDVTPLSLHQAESGETQAKPSKLFMEEVLSSSGSESSSSLFCSRFSTLSFETSLTSATETSSPLTSLPQPPTPHEVPREPDTVTEEILDEVVDICLTETDSVSLLDIPSTLVSEDSDDAETVRKTNIQYTELCKRRLCSDKFVAHAAQTFWGAPKDKEVQCDNIVMVDEGTVAKVWDIWDSFHNQHESPASVEANYLLPSTVDTIKGPEEDGERNPQRVLLSKSLLSSLVIMERSILTNIIHPKLAAYKGLPILKDPDSVPEDEQGSQEAEDRPLTPTLEPLWDFRCEITNECSVTSMVWNRKNPDLVAVSYGDLDSTKHRPTFICCWSLKNPMWPERVFQCHSCVTSLDFSANRPSQLAVGMLDGTVAVYDVRRPDSEACVASSSNCLNRPLHPVWQVIWTKAEMRLTGREREEALVSVSEDGRVIRWAFSSSGLDNIDLMNLGRLKVNMSSDVFSAVTPGFCIDFHPKNYGIYLIGTGSGLIYTCSVFNSKHCLEMYQAHTSPVNHIEWSPFSPDLFLCCSADWSIQLWKRGHFAPMLSFTSTQRVVHTAKWSPDWPTVFAAINEQQLEIWNLASDVLTPTIVHYNTPGAAMTELLFAPGTDCALVGGSDGQVTVYNIKNLNVGQKNQVDGLEDVIRSRLVVCSSTQGELQTDSHHI
ncbi:dynein axonemal intermediate chain 4-like isoform X2 [Betta splendens]|uniref:Dynein axonemal intermediate chain 4 n=1 Tax=Betta splendens TaxID=158456 RepID=A0A6P7MSS6_BETSP|nr:dynein axonemal intermediate chain 4-like isoform X2 [Betta splendens]